MGYLKHLYGDDMTPEERDRLDHAELVQQMAPDIYGRTNLSDAALRKFHDRYYGVASECTWCTEPAREKVAAALPSIEAAFMRPSSDPQPKGDEPKPPVSQNARLPIALSLAETAAFMRAMGLGGNVACSDPNCEKCRATPPPR